MSNQYVVGRFSGELPADALATQISCLFSAMYQLCKFCITSAYIRDGKIRSKGQQPAGHESRTKQWQRLPEPLWSWPLWVSWRCAAIWRTLTSKTIRTPLLTFINGIITGLSARAAPFYKEAP